MEARLSGPKDRPKEAGSSDRYFVWSVLLITAITYLGTVRFGFVYDDYPQILFNPFIKAWEYVPEYFSSSVWKHMDPQVAGNYYRPLFLLWERINYAMFESRPLGWHVGVLFLHLAATWLVYLTINKLIGRPNVAWMTALIFGLHPMHHEVVAWVSGATESIFAIPFLLAFLAYLRSRESSRKAWMAASIGFYGVALLCKETAIVLPALVFMHAWISDRAPDPLEKRAFLSRAGQGMMEVAGYFPIALVYLAIRYKVLSGFGHALSNVSASTWLFTLPSVLLFYIRNWILPVRLSINYDLFFQQHLDLRHVLLPAAIVTAIGSAVWIFRNRLNAREVGFAAAWIVLPLLPALDYVVFKPDELVHDRYFYVPSIGAALLIALIIERVGKSRRLVFGTPAPIIAAAFVLTVALAAGSARATSFWTDGYTLFTRAHEIAPLNSVPVNNLSVEYIERGEIDQAQTLLEPSYRQHHENLRFAYNLGRVAYLKHQYPRAEELVREAIAIDPSFGDSYLSLGLIQLKENHRSDALQSIRRAVELNPFDPRFHTSYGIVLEGNGDCPAATSQFQAALALNPGDGLTQMEMFRCRGAAPASDATSAPAKP